MLPKKRSGPSTSRPTERNGTPQQLIKSLTSERDALRRHVLQLRRENRLLKESLGKALFGETKANKRALLNEFRRRPSFAELIARLD